MDHVWPHLLVFRVSPESVLRDHLWWDSGIICGDKYRKNLGQVPFLIYYLSSFLNMFLNYKGGARIIIKHVGCLPSHSQSRLNH